MKLFQSLSPLLLVTPTLACLKIVGTVTNDDGQLEYARVIDNGLLVCSNSFGWRFDQDNHFSVTCVGQAIFAFTRDLTFGWYRNVDGATFSFGLNRHDDQDATDFDATLYGC